MISPFPGMDPYLENVNRWPGVHDGMIAAMRAILNPLLPPNYVAVINERCRVQSDVPRSIYPDVFLRPKRSVESVPHSRGGSAIMALPDPPIIVKAASEEERKTYLEIVDVSDNQRIITEIELLSPSNKTSGKEDRVFYLQKQKEILYSRTHLLEIDLLRTGFPTVSAYSNNYGSHEGDYLICLHRACQLEQYETWPVKMTDRLPCVAVPLDEGVPDVALDLQAVFDRNYDEGAYSSQIDYSRDPFPPLSEDQAKWADVLLREKGLRGNI